MAVRQLFHVLSEVFVTARKITTESGKTEICQTSERSNRLADHVTLAVLYFKRKSVVTKNLLPIKPFGISKMGTDNGNGYFRRRLENDVEVVMPISVKEPSLLREISTVTMTTLFRQLIKSREATI